MVKGTKKSRAKQISTEGQLSPYIIRGILKSEKEQRFLEYLKSKKKVDKFCTNVSEDLNNFLRHPKKALKDAIKCLPGTSILSFVVDLPMLPSIHEYYDDIEDEYIKDIW